MLTPVWHRSLTVGPSANYHNVSMCVCGCVCANRHRPAKKTIESLHPHWVCNITRTHTHTHTRRNAGERRHYRTERAAAECNDLKALTRPPVTTHLTDGEENSQLLSPAGRSAHYASPTAPSVLAPSLRPNINNTQKNQHHHYSFHYHYIFIHINIHIDIHVYIFLFWK